MEHYNIRSRPTPFEVGDSVLVLLPSSTNKLVSTWQGPGTINLKLSPNSYYWISMPDGAIRHLHANHLREFKIRVQGVGVIYDAVCRK